MKASFLNSEGSSNHLCKIGQVDIRWKEDKEKEARLAVVLQLLGRAVRRRRGEEAAAKVSGLCSVRGWKAAGIAGVVDWWSSLRKSVRDGAIKKVVKGERES